MEFWGVEVKPGETVKCDPGEDKYLHLSQASLGEVKKDKGNENVPIFVKFNDQKLVLGTLSAEKCAQISYDLVFEKEFELSHSSKNVSVYFCGYKTVVADDDETDDFPDSDFDSDEDIQLGQKVNDDSSVPLSKYAPTLAPASGSQGKTEVKDEQEKPSSGKVSVKAVASAAKPKVKIEEANKAEKQKTDEDDEDDGDDESDEDEDESEEVSDDDDEDVAEAEDGSDDEDEDASSDEEDEATPQKTESGKKKRPAGSASKTPAPEKKAKLVSPVGSHKTGGDGKKGGHTATPHPAKYAGKTPASTDKSKQQTPKSAGSVSCKSCSKTFNSENALQAHTKAKHGIAK